MPLPRRTPDWCPECLRPVRGYPRVSCPDCRTVNPSAGFAGLAEKRRAAPDSPKKRSRYAIRPAV
jgi:hypothetical protein